ncbi:MAG: amino acid racemase [Anaerovoracaceae bacterium]
MKILDGKVLGVIGGMGPMATDMFYKMITQNTKVKCDQEHINMIILSHATMPDRTKALKDGETDLVLEKLMNDAKFLKNSGADFVVIPCNTAHAIFAEPAKANDIPFINMIEETANKAAAMVGKGGKVGVMATDGTIEIGLYQNALNKLGIEAVTLSKGHQSKVMKIIYEGIKMGEPVNHEDFQKAAEELKAQGCQLIILGCTELSVYKIEEGLGEFYLDAMECLVNKAIEACR